MAAYLNFIAGFWSLSDKGHENLANASARRHKRYKQEKNLAQLTQSIAEGKRLSKKLPEKIGYFFEAA
jgi:hypothetical protein